MIAFPALKRWATSESQKHNIYVFGLAFPVLKSWATAESQTLKPPAIQKTSQSESSQFRFGKYCSSDVAQDFSPGKATAILYFKMGHTFSDNLVHVVFSTKERERFAEERMDRICEFMGGIARKNGFRMLAMGSTEDHVHLLVQISPTMSISKAVQLVKGGSSKWYHDTFGEEQFGWQEGFSAFSVSRSIADKVEAYIRNQKEHHKKRDFAEELRAILKKHGVEFEEKYLLD